MARTTPRWSWLLALLALATGCGFESRLGAGGPDRDGGSDAERDGNLDAFVPLGPWGAPVEVPIPGSLGGDDDPTLTDDRLEMYFNRTGDIYVTKRATTSAAWGTPARVDELSSTSNETTPEITSDGLTMFLASGRNGGADSIFMATRATRTAAWSTPIVIAEVSSTAGDAAPATTDDLLAMVITSARTGGPDLYLSTRATTGDAWSTPQPLAGINSGAADYSPILSQDKLQLYYDSNPTGNADLHVATRASTGDAFPAGAAIAELDSNLEDADPWISADGRHIVFVSNRTGTYAMYEASR